MADVAGPFDGVAFSEDDWSQLFRQFTRDGVDNGDTNLQVVTGTGLQVKVKAGRATVQGFLYRNSDGADRAVAISANASGNPRIDRVIVRINRATNTGTLAVLVGTPGVTPVAPSLTQVDGGTWEISLAQVYVINGAASFTSGDITDERDFLGQWKPYTPVWTGASSNPAIGNGTLSGYYNQRGRTVVGWIRLNPGGTTTYGTGAWSFTLPVACASTFPTDMIIGAARLWDNSRTFRLLGAVLRTTSTTIEIETSPSVIMEQGDNDVVYAAAVSSNTRTVNLTAGRFTSTPWIGLTTKARVTNLEVSAPGTGSFQVIGRRTDDTNYTGTDGFSWIALQRLQGGSISDVVPFDVWGANDSVRAFFMYEAAA